ncbi:F0F1 ATP synthase subunit epsilon, partial [bacterium]|nr:F0F1 ATP synthase subunit epsilon [bacterium]
SDDIDIERAMASMKRAEDRLHKTGKYDEARSTAALERALQRVQIAEKRQS